MTVYFISDNHGKTCIATALSKQTIRFDALLLECASTDEVTTPLSARDIDINLTDMFRSKPDDTDELVVRDLTSTVMTFAFDDSIKAYDSIERHNEQYEAIVKIIRSVGITKTVGIIVGEAHLKDNEGDDINWKSHATKLQKAMKSVQVIVL
ncbi:hypothetical protein ASU80_20400 [Enterobacter hormaechei subsp. xiangfangensis]|uniref:hypothetical protein n=1 Tax=Enterobacter hormaechei TaxID=158836 RepID=UPI00073555C9|nr:hypothetical protein [Enterobacter hormaechei]KTI13297.1 hypothetical protein ASV11_21165 [Enterobacter hormaechei subsp. xiangfangensis]KTJ63468.1 hypothetical protein ASU80_20400 [Enterobacter hormaechei subsp. xiangfangensis]MDR9967928.1 hypothetical protein [Enterobacter hormaechei subsp. xiangfangensis]